MRTIYREQKYVCGEYLDVNIFPTYKTATQRKRRSQPTSEVQAKLNQRHREEKLARLFHANFTPDDCEIHLTYAEQPESPERARADLRNYLERLARLRKKAGLEPLKYIGVTERGNNGRYHHHVTVNGGLSRDAMEEKWGFGYANTRRLQFSETGLAGLANYIVKDSIFRKTYTASRNLIDPEPRTRDGRISAKKAQQLASMPGNSEAFEKLYPGYILAEANTFLNDVNKGYYIYARFYRADGKFIKPRRKRRKRRDD